METTEKPIKKKKRPKKRNKRCEGWSRQNNRPCKKYAVAGRNYCMKHGGNNPVGPANGSWKHGKYSTYMPDFYKEKMAALAALGSDPSGHVEEIHLVEARILELCENLNTGESQEAWKELGEHFEELMLAVHADAEEHIESHASQIRAILQGSKGRDRLWTQINRQIEFRRRLSESQLKKEVSLNALFTIKEVVMILSAISAAVQDNVQDQKALQAIQAAFERAMPQQVPSTQDGETLH